MARLRGHRKKWSDEVVYTWAVIYTENHYTLDRMEQNTGISHSTLWWCFIHRLPGIDEALAVRVFKQLNANKCHRQERSA